MSKLVNKWSNKGQTPTQWLTFFWILQIMLISNHILYLENMTVKISVKYFSSLVQTLGQTMPLITPISTRIFLLAQKPFHLNQYNIS